MAITKPSLNAAVLTTTAAAPKLSPGENAPGEGQAARTLGTVAEPVWQDPPMLSAAQKLPPGEGAPGEDQAASTLGTMAAPVWQDPPMRSAAQKLPPGEGAPGAAQAARTANGPSLPALLATLADGPCECFPG